MSTNIQVAVRVRPFLPLEAGARSCIDVLPGEDHPTCEKVSQGKSVRIGTHSSSVHKDGGHTFTFDRCFSGLATQVEIYTSLVLPLLKSCMEGYNATTLAYGQTGAGKTYTTLGPATSPDFFSPQNNGEQHRQEFDSVGILPRALRDLFRNLEEKRLSLNGGGEAETNHPAGDENNNVINGDHHSSVGSTSSTAADSGLGIKATKASTPKKASNKDKSKKEPFEYQVKLQFLELYGEEVRDLLASSLSSKTKIIIREHAGDAEALGATAVPVASAQEAMLCLTRGMLRRVTGATAMNAESSRSHAIMSVQLEQITRTDGDGQGQAVVVRKSKYNFVDLAGSERSKRTHAKGQRLKEGININKGLLVLGNVISSLAAGEKFVPFRDSKLTRLLKGSLGGNHKTLMIACASPSHKNAEESLNCLRYANRAKNIKNKASVNVDPHSKLVNALRGQVSSLAGELLRLSKNGGGKVDNERFTLRLLEVLVKGGKESQGVVIGEEPKAKATEPLVTAESKPAVSDSPDNQSTSVDELTAELEKTRLSLKETQLNLKEREELLEEAISERNNLRRASDTFSAESERTPNKPEATFSLATPSRAIGMSRDESIQDILTTLSNAGGADVMSPDAISEGTEEMDKEPNGLATLSYEGVQTKRIEELSAEVATLRASLDRSKQVVNEKEEELETALVENESLRERLRDTPDIDEETIHEIVSRITSYQMYHLDEEEEEDESLSVESESTVAEEDEGKRKKQEETESFASAMFSTGKFLVDRELFPDSIVCFETVLEVRRELYGWDDPLVGDALHMEGFVRSKMGDYDRALMLLWDALRIRKIASEPLKISATLRLLADLHFSKEENMHAALFYEECARHLKEHDIHDPHLPLVLIDLARTKDRLGEYAESMNFFEEALGLYQHSLDVDDDRIASLQYEMGVLAFQMGDRERGEECFRHFIRIRKSKGSALDEGVANALFVLGSLHWATKKRDLAQECWHEALGIFKGLGRTDDDPYVRSLKEKIHRAQRRPIARIFRGS